MIGVAPAVAGVLAQFCMWAALDVVPCVDRREESRLAETQQRLQSFSANTSTTDLNRQADKTLR